MLVCSLNFFFPLLNLILFIRSKIFGYSVFLKPGTCLGAQGKRAEGTWLGTWTRLLSFPVSNYQRSYRRVKGLLEVFLVNQSLWLLIISVPLLWTSSSLFISSSNEVPELHTVFQVWLRKKCMERCCASLPHCAMLLQNKPGVPLALLILLWHIASNIQIILIFQGLFPRWCFPNFASLLCLVNSSFWISPLVHAVAFFPTAVLMLVSCLCFQFLYTPLYYFSVHTCAGNSSFLPTSMTSLWYFTGYLHSVINSEFGSHLSSVGICCRNSWW